MDKILKFKTYSDFEDYVNEIGFFSGKIETGSLFQINKNIYIVKDFSKILKNDLGPCKLCSLFSSCGDYTCPFNFQTCAVELSEIEILILLGEQNENV